MGVAPALVPLDEIEWMNGNESDDGTDAVGAEDQG